MQGEESRHFTLEEVQKNDGKEGRPLYLIFRGKVYDVSSSRLWIGGKHMGIHVREESLGETIKNAPHGEETLARFSIVGEVVENLPTAAVPGRQAVETPAQALPAPIGRRDFLKLAAAAGGALTLAAFASSLKTLSYVPTLTSQLSWPRVKLANSSQLQALKPIIVNYPLTHTPNHLVMMNQTAQGGVGPNNAIVAFSAICQHLGCIYGFVPPGGFPPCNPSLNGGSGASVPQGYCCCHGSQYDFLHGAQVIGGPAPRPVPQVQLEYNDTTGDIYAVAMGPPTIFGHGPAGTTEPSLVMQYDLSGGTVVSSSP